MAEYMTEYKITNADDTEMLAALEWIKDNHAAKVHSAHGDGKTKVITLTMIDTTFADAVTSVTAIKTQFTTRLADDWSVIMQ
jgi:hypothetical protein